MMPSNNLLAKNGKKLLKRASSAEGDTKMGNISSSSSKTLSRKTTQKDNRHKEYLEKVDMTKARRPGVVPKMWTAQQDELLRQAVARYGEKNWKLIADYVPDRTHLQCLQRWKKALRPGLVKGHWKKEEDKHLLSLVKGSGRENNWNLIAAQIPGRNAKQCRERWFLNLDPSISREPWSVDEDKLLLDLHKELGGKWSLIAKRIPGRTENSVKTRYHSLQRQQARNRGWTPEEDRVMLAGCMELGRDWAAIVKRLPGRSKGQLKKRFGVLVKENPKLALEVEEVEERVQAKKELDAKGGGTARSGGGAKRRLVRQGDSWLAPMVQNMTSPNPVDSIPTIPAVPSFAAPFNKKSSIGSPRQMVGRSASTAVLFDTLNRAGAASAAQQPYHPPEKRQKMLTKKQSTSLSAISQILNDEDFLNLKQGFGGMEIDNHDPLGVKAASKVSPTNSLNSNLSFEGLVPLGSSASKPHKLERDHSLQRMRSSDGMKIMSSYANQLGIGANDPAFLNSLNAPDGGLVAPPNRQESRMGMRKFSSQMSLGLGAVDFNMDFGGSTGNLFRQSSLRDILSN